MGNYYIFFGKLEKCINLFDIFMIKPGESSRNNGESTKKESVFQNFHTHFSCFSHFTIFSHVEQMKICLSDSNKDCQ